MYNPVLNPAKLLTSHLIGILPYPNIPPTTKKLCSCAGGTEEQRFLPLNHLTGVNTEVQFTEIVIYLGLLS